MKGEKRLDTLESKLRMLENKELERIGLWKIELDLCFIGDILRSLTVLITPYDNARTPGISPTSSNEQMV